VRLPASRVVDRTVLIVDDDARFRSLAARLLRMHGLAVAGEVGAAGAGLAAAHELRPDAALVDVGLPDGDGIALASELAGLPWSPRVLVTSSDAENAQAARRSRLPFVAKEDLPAAPLRALLGAEPAAG
jgi:DNA-binding NarL/FixJ family response regulator